MIHHFNMISEILHKKNTFYLLFQCCDKYMYAVLKLNQITVLKVKLINFQTSSQSEILCIAASENEIFFKYVQKKMDFVLTNLFKSACERVLF